MEPVRTLRRRMRVCALQILYQMDIAGELVSARTARASAAAATRRYFASFADPAGDDEPLAGRLVGGVIDGLLDLDARIAAVSTHWKLGRMGVVDRNLLRLAAFEMDGPEALPKQVALNEAIEIAREYGGAESPAFVNAVLDRLAPATAAAEV